MSCVDVYCHYLVVVCCEGMMKSWRGLLICLILQMVVMGNREQQL